MENGNNDEEQKELSNDSVHSAMSTPSEELDSDATTITGSKDVYFIFVILNRLLTIFKFIYFNSDTKSYP